MSALLLAPIQSVLSFFFLVDAFFLYFLLPCVWSHVVCVCLYLGPVHLRPRAQSYSVKHQQRIRQTLSTYLLLSRSPSPPPHPPSNQVLLLWRWVKFRGDLIYCNVLGQMGGDSTRSGCQRVTECWIVLVKKTEVMYDIKSYLRFKRAITGTEHAVEGVRPQTVLLICDMARFSRT